MEGLLKELTDFTLLRKRQEDFNSLASGGSTGSGLELDFQSDEMILRSFRDLRQKLKNSQKECQQARQELKSLQREVNQLRDSEGNLRTNNLQLKQKMVQGQLALEQARKRNTLLKQALSEHQEIQKQTAILKEGVAQAQARALKAEQQRKKLLEISVQDKVEAEERMARMQAKILSDQNYIVELQQGLLQAKQSNLRLENQSRKLQIQLDENLFQQQWNHTDFQTEKMVEQLRQAENEVSELKRKLKAEKGKRTQIQKRVLQLQETAGLWGVRAEAFEGEAGLMSQKLKTMERRASQAKAKASRMTVAKTTWEQRFMKAVLISQQLISRAKRQLSGDIYDIAKSCEYRLNKLKDGKENALSIPKQGSSIPKRRPRTDQKQRKSPQQRQILTSSRCDSTGYKCLQNTDAKGVLTQATPSNQIQRQKESIVFAPLEQRVRKQRQQMEKKLRQRLLYRKMETCVAPQKAKLREDYLKLMMSKV